MLNSCKPYLYSVLGFVHERGIYELIKKASSLWQREGLKGLKRALFDILNSGISYRDWILKYDTLSNEDRILIKEHIAQLNHKPLISVLMPVYNTPEKWLRRSIESVRAQLYQNWELCIADDASTMPHVRVVLKEAAAGDPRIKIVYRSSNGHISAATNSALEKARGEYIALLDHDDELAECALYHVAAGLNRNPELDLIYSDEDKIDSKGRRFGHYFKPDWNYDLFLGQNLISHLGVYRTHIARSIGGFREGFEGSQDWDFALRFIEQINPENILHLPYVLYHWRSIPGSTAISVDEKGYAMHAAKRALQEFWQRKKVNPSIEHIASGHFRTKLNLPDVIPQVTVVILSTEDQLEKLPQILEEIQLHTNYSNIEFFIAYHANDSAVADEIELLMCEQNVKLLSYPNFSSRSEVINCAFGQASGEFFCLLDGNTQPSDEDWMRELISQALQMGVGVVGGVTHYPNNTIHDAGCIWNEGAIGYLHSGCLKGVAGYINRTRLVQNLSIVSTTCVVVSKAVWLDVSGLNSSYSYNLSIIDLCLRVKEKGYRNIWTPFAKFAYAKLAKRTSVHVEEDFLKKWNKFTDPAWNPNLLLKDRYIQLASPPRVQKPWRSYAE